MVEDIVMGTFFLSIVALAGMGVYSSADTEAYIVDPKFGRSPIIGYECRHQIRWGEDYVKFSCDTQKQCIELCIKESK